MQIIEASDVERLGFFPGVAQARVVRSLRVEGLHFPYQTRIQILRQAMPRLRRGCLRKFAPLRVQFDESHRMAQMETVLAGQRIRGSRETDMTLAVVTIYLPCIRKFKLIHGIPPQFSCLLNVFPSALAWIDKVLEVTLSRFFGSVSQKAISVMFLRGLRFFHSSSLSG